MRFVFHTLPFVLREFPTQDGGRRGARTSSFRKDIEDTYADIVDCVIIAKQEVVVSGEEWPFQPRFQLVNEDPDIGHFVQRAKRPSTRVPGA